MPGGVAASATGWFGGSGGKVTGDVSGLRAAGVRAHTGREIEQVLCAERFAAARGGRVTAEAPSFSTGVLDFVKYARRIGDAFRQAIRGATRTGHRG